MHAIERLLAIMARLRDPAGGCPWDLEQSFETIAPYTIEEAYEVDDAIRRGDLEALREELGDLLLQVVFHAQMAREGGRFAFGDVVDSICDKLVRRHPHVFAEAEVRSTAEQLVAWEEHKAAERRQKGASEAPLAGVALGLPALLRAQKLQRRAARAGLASGVPLDAAWEAFRAALAGSDPERLAHALGDLLFSVSDAAGRAGADSERALRDANARFEVERG
jgi:MazG family protein